MPTDYRIFGSSGEDRNERGSGRWWRLLVRSIVAGAVSGVLAAWFLFFVFGYLGFAGAAVMVRVRNGWEAALALGTGRGLVIGIAIAAGLAIASILWAVLTDRFKPSHARAWLAGLAAAIVIVGNTDSIGRFRAWDGAGIATILSMALLVAGSVWLVAPWVMRPLTRESRDREA